MYRVSLRDARWSSDGPVLSIHGVRDERQVARPAPRARDLTFGARTRGDSVLMLTRKAGRVHHGPTTLRKKNASEAAAPMHGMKVQKILISQSVYGVLNDQPRPRDTNSTEGSLNAVQLAPFGLIPRYLGTGYPRCGYRRPAQGFDTSARTGSCVHLD